MKAKLPSTYFTLKIINGILKITKEVDIMGLMYGRKDTLGKLFEKFAADPNKKNDPNAKKYSKKGEREEAAGIDLPEINKNNEIDQKILEEERKKQKIVK